MDYLSQKQRLFKNVRTTSFLNLKIKNMKAILYIGATLMVGASIYGFIDYKKSSHDKKFRNLYDNKEQVATATKEQALNSVKEEPAKPLAEVKVKKLPVGTVSKIKDKKLTVAKKRKTINYKQFSRARIEEKILKEEVKREVSKEPLKVEKKEQ